VGVDLDKAAGLENHIVPDRHQIGSSASAPTIEQLADTPHCRVERRARPHRIQLAPKQIGEALAAMRAPYELEEEAREKSPCRPKIGSNDRTIHAERGCSEQSDG
jgi:hypothetical protein